LHRFSIPSDKQQTCSDDKTKGVLFQSSKRFIIIIIIITIPIIIIMIIITVIAAITAGEKKSKYVLRKLITEILSTVKDGSHCAVVQLPKTID